MATAFSPDSAVAFLSMKSQEEEQQQKLDGLLLDLASKHLPKDWLPGFIKLSIDAQIAALLLVAKIKGSTQIYLTCQSLIVSFRNIVTINMQRISRKS